MEGEGVSWLCPIGTVTHHEELGTGSSDPCKPCVVRLHLPGRLRPPCRISNSSQGGKGGGVFAGEQPSSRDALLCDELKADRANGGSASRTIDVIAAAHASFRNHEVRSHPSSPSSAPPPPPPPSSHYIGRGGLLIVISGMSSLFLSNGVKYVSACTVLKLPLHAVVQNRRLEVLQSHARADELRTVSRRRLLTRKTSLPSSSSHRQLERERGRERQRDRERERQRERKRERERDRGRGSFRQPGRHRGALLI